MLFPFELYLSAPGIHADTSHAITNSMSVGELKALASLFQVDIAHCLEKQELVEALRDAQHAIGK